MYFSKFKSSHDNVKHQILRLDFKSGKRMQINFSRGVRGSDWNCDMFTKDVYNKMTQYGIYLGRFAFVFMVGFPMPNGKVVSPQ